MYLDYHTHGSEGQIGPVIPKRGSAQPSQSHDRGYIGTTFQYPWRPSCTYHSVPLKLGKSVLAFGSHSDPPALEPWAKHFTCMSVLSSSIKWEPFMDAPSSVEGSGRGRYTLVQSKCSAGIGSLSLNSCLLLANLK